MDFKVFGDCTLEIVQDRDCLRYLGKIPNEDPNYYLPPLRTK